MPAARTGDPLTPHARPEHPPHPRKIAGGSASVFIDGLPAARTGDAVDCGVRLLRTIWMMHSWIWVCG
ncbi:TPA: PAAR domain-containing protein, partial [Salmonella enterica]|nr:PAAR domain-containing protein [Salmonella enterica]